MLTLDPRTLSTTVYRNLKQVKERATTAEQWDKQKSQAVDLYTYVSVWGLLRLKGEDPALKNEAEKQKIVRCFFKTLGEIAYPGRPNPLADFDAGFDTLTALSASEYLGLTGLALQVAREFSFWAEALYIKADSSDSTTVDAHP